MRHLTYVDRQKIEWCLMHRMSKRQIAQELGCCLKTVYNELSRPGVWYPHTDKNGVDHMRYSSQIAQQDYDMKSTAKGYDSKLGNNWEFVKYIEEQIISKKASPAVALSRWDKMHDDFTVSVKTLYRYIDAGIYFPNLTNKDLPERPYRKRTYNHIRKSKRPPKGTSIELRPKEIGKRESFGHWEMDCVVGKKEGKKEAVLVLTERLTRFEIIVKLQDKTSNSVVSALDKLQRKYDFNLFKSITVDNGSEFQDCRGMEYDSKGNKRTQLYYCHPYASCERGSNERHNRIIRRFLKKGESMAKVTQKECDHISQWMNDYPRQVLGWNTPADLFQEYAV